VPAGVGSFIVAGVWCSGGCVPTLCSVPNVRDRAVVEKILPGIAPIWCGVWLTERLESHQTVNACSALCLNAVGQVGLVLMVSWESLKGRDQVGCGFFRVLGWELDGSLLYLVEVVAAIGSACS
jgi:hypothetical protein